MLFVVGLTDLQETTLDDTSSILKGNMRVIDRLNEVGSNKQCILIALLVVMVFAILYYSLSNK